MSLFQKKLGHGTKAQEVGRYLGIDTQPLVKEILKSPFPIYSSYYRDRRGKVKPTLSLEMA